MATLFNTKISNTYQGLLKTVDNAAISATLRELSDGSGNQTGLYLNTAGDFKVTSVLEWGSLKDTGTGVTITRYVTSTDGLENFDNNTSLPTSAAVKLYVDTKFATSDTLQEVLSFGNTTSGNDIVVSLNDDITFTDSSKALFGNSQDLEINHNGTDSFVTDLGTGDLRLRSDNSIKIQASTGGNNLATFTKGAGVDLYFNNAKKLETTNIGISVTGIISNLTNPISAQDAATKSYVDALDAGSDLDITDGTNTGAVNLNTQTLSILGTTNEIEAVVSGQGVTIGLPSSISADLVGNVTGNLTGNVAGDLTGNVTSTSVLANGVTATTQASTDSSTKVATTAYVKGLDNASDLDFSGDSGTGDVNLNAQTFAITGTANQIESSASNQGLSLQFPTAGVTLPNGSVATTQSAGDNSTKVATTSYVDTSAALYLPLAGGTMSGNTIHNDSIKSIYGTGSDAQVYHDGSNFYANNSTGQLNIDQSAVTESIVFKTSDANALDTTALIINRGGDLITGRDVTIAGDLTVNGTTTTVNSQTLSVDDPLISLAINNDANSLDIGYYGKYNDGTTRYLGLFNDASDSNKFKLFKGTTVEPTTTVNIGAAGYAAADLELANLVATGNINLADNGKAIFGTGNDLQIYHDGSNSYIQDSGTGNLVVASNAFYLQKANQGANMIVATENAAVQLFYNGGEKLSTTSTGVSVTGGGTFTGDVTSSNGTAGTFNLGNSSYKIQGGSNFGDLRYTAPRHRFYEDTNLVMSIDGGNVGIGTASPDRELEVEGNGNVYIRVTASTDTDSSAIELKNTQETWTINNADTNDDALQFQSDALTAMTILKTGNVGIGTTSPNANLDILNGTTGASLKLSATATAYWQLQRDSTTGNLNISDDALGNVMSFDQLTGNVGIGTDSPRAALQVAKGISAAVPTPGDNTACAVFGNSTSDNNYGLVLGALGSGTSYISSQRTNGASTTYNLAIQPNGGNVGIGTTSPVNYSGYTSLEIDGANGAILRLDRDDNAVQFEQATVSDLVYLKTVTASDMWFGTNNTERMRITSGGEVLISNSDARLKGGDATGRFIVSNSDTTSYISLNGSSNASPNDISIITDEEIIFNTGSGYSEAMRITSGGDVQVKGGQLEVQSSGVDSGYSIIKIGTDLSNDYGSQISSLTYYNAVVSTDLRFSTTNTLGVLTEAMKIGGNGNVGIGTELNLGKLSVRSDSGASSFYNNIQCVPSDSISGGLFIGSNVASDAIMVTGAYYKNAGKYTPTATTASSINMFSGNTRFFGDTGLTVGTEYTPTERMRITNGGQLLIGTQNSQGVSSRVSAKPLTPSGVCYETKTDSDNYYPMFFHNAAGVQKGYIFTNATSTSYNTSSDYRLKEDLKDFAGLDMVSKIPVYDFKWKTDESRSFGVMAHELQEVLPDAVVGEKDAEEMQGVDYSKIVPLLIKSIQELKAEIDILKAK